MGRESKSHRLKEVWKGVVIGGSRGAECRGKKEGKRE